MSAFTKIQNKGKLLAVWLLPNTSGIQIFCIVLKRGYPWILKFLSWHITMHIFSAIFQDFLYFRMGHYLLFYEREFLISNVEFLYWKQKGIPCSDTCILYYFMNGNPLFLIWISSIISWMEYPSTLSKRNPLFLMWKFSIASWKESPFWTDIPSFCI